MGTVQVPGRISGKTYNLKIKGDTPSKSEQARIRAFLDQKESAFATDYEAKYGAPLAVDDGTALGRGLEAGKASAFSRLGTATEYLGSGLGLESLVSAGQGMRQAGDYEGFLESLRQPAPTKREDVTGLGSALTYAGEGVGQSIPEMLAPLAAGAAGTIAGTAATGNPFTGGAIGLAASGVTAFPSFFGGNIQRQEAEVDAGRKAEVDVQSALTSALGQSALNAVGDKLLLGGFLKPGQKWLTRTLIGGAEGAVAEVPTEIAQQMLERKQAGLALDSDDAISEYIDAGILGGIMGGGVRATTAGLGVGMEKKPKAQEEAPKAEKEAPKTPVVTPAVVPPEAQEEAPRVPFPFTVKSGPVSVPVTERTAVVPPSAPTRWSSPESDDFDAAERFAAEDRAVADPAQKDLFERTPPTVTLPTAKAVEPTVLTDDLVTQLGIRAAKAAPLRTLVGKPLTDTKVIRALDSWAQNDRATEENKQLARSLITGQPTTPVAAPVVAPAPQTRAGLKSIPFDQYERKPNSQELVPGTNVRGEAPIIDLSGRKIVMRDVNGVQVPFYLSSGQAGKKNVAAGKWYPILGIGADGWINKGSQDEINNYYGSPELRDAAQELDATIGDIRNDTTIPKVKPSGAHIDAINMGLTPTENQLDTTVASFKANLANLLDRIKQGAAPADTTPAPETADVATPAETQPEAVGSSVASGLQGVEGGRGTGSTTEAAPGPEAPAAVGLGTDMSVPAGPTAPEGQQPAALTPETPAEARTPARQLIPGTRTPVDPSTLQPIGKPRVERDELYAPVKTAPAKVSRDIQEQAALADLVSAYVARTTPEYRNQTGTGGGINSKTKFAEVPEWTTLEDKLVVLGLLESTPTSPQEKAAKLYFSKTVRPSDALDMMIDDLTAAYQLYNNTIRSTGARSADPDFELKKDTGSGPAALALEWVRDGNLDDATVDKLNFKIALDAQATQNLKNWSKDDRVVEGRAAEIRAKENTLIESYLSGYFAPGSPDAVRAAQLVERRADAAERARDAADLAKLAAKSKNKTKNSKANAKKMAAADREVSSIKKEFIRGNPLAALDQQLHYSVKAALERGDLKGALLALSETTNNANLSKLAARFAELTGTTRVKVLYPGDPAKNIGRARGAYWAAPAGSDPEQTNIIYLNGQIGMDVHVLMHEMAHAVTAGARYLQPNHPVLKQLEALRKDIMKQSGHRADRDAFYGLTDLAEFIAEGFGRVGFGETDNGLLDLMKRTNIYTEVGYQRQLPLNAAQRFKEIVGNFLRSLVGLPSKPYPRKTEYDTRTVKENAMDQFQRLVDGILSEAPQVLPDSAFQKAISSPMVSRTILNNAIQNAPIWDGAGREKLADMMQASVPTPLRRMLLGLLHLDWFDDLAGKYFPEIRELKVIDDLRRGDLVRLVDMSKPVHADLQKYATKQPEMMSRLAAIQGRATLEQVDPTRPVSDYGADQDKVRVWHELKRDLKQGGPEMQALFKTVRNMMASYRTEIKAVLAERVKALSDDVAMQNQLVSRLMAKLDEGNVIDPYFSLMRKGDFWLSYTSEDTTGEALLVDPAAGTMKRPTTQFVQAFESVWEREQFKTKLAAMKDAQGNDIAWDVEEFMRPVTYVKGQTVPSAFVQGAINVITGMVQPGATTAEQDTANEAISAIQDMFVRFTPEHSLMKSFTQRKGTRGFIGDITPLNVVDSPLDIVNALAEKSSSLAYQLANMKYGAKIQALRNRAKATEKTLNKSPSLTAAEKVAVQAYLEEFDARADFAQSPNVSKTAQVARGVTFGMTLGFNIAGAANNLMQILMVGLPELAGRYGMSTSLREIGSASRLLMNAGKTYKVMSYGPDGPVSRELSGVDNFGSIANYFEVDAAGNYVPRTDKKIPAKLRQKLANMDVLVEALSVNGMLSNSMAQEMLETEAGWGQKINKWSGFLMHHGERYNRQAVAIAAYNLELGNIKGPISKEAKIAAAKKAIDATERVNGSIGASTAPRYAQGGFGSVVFMFKRFGLNMARYIINTANQALKKITPGMSQADIDEAKKERAIARYQITGILGATALFAGVQGLPFFGELMSLINLIFTDDDEESAEVILQKYLQEPFYNGALNYLTGAEIASRISLSGLIFRENKIEKDQSLLYDLVETFGGPAVGVFMNAERGVGLLSQGETYRGIEAMMPSVIKSAMKSVRYGTEGATTLRRDEIVPLSNMDVAMQFLGYTPGVYARTQERVSGQKRIDESVRVEKRNLYRKYYLAYLDGDFEELRDILKEMQEFSRNNPEEQITGKKLSQSLNSNLQRSKEMIGGVSFSPNFRPRAVRELDEFDEDTSLWAS